MYKTTSIAALLLAAMAAPSTAQELNAASVSGHYTAFTDDTSDDTYFSVDGGVEFGIAPNFALGGNLGIYNSSADDANTITNVTGHGLYMITPTTGLGGFAAAEADGDNEATLYGIEFGTGSATSRGEAYFGWTDNDVYTEDTTISGFSFEFAVVPQFTIGLGYEAITVEDSAIVGGSVEDLTIRDTSLIARYLFEGGASVFAEVGQVGLTAVSGGTVFVSEEDSEYFTIGAEFAMGRPSGTLVSERTLFGFGL